MNAVRPAAEPDPVWDSQTVTIEADFEPDFGAEFWQAAADEFEIRMARPAPPRDPERPARRLARYALRRARDVSPCALLEELAAVADEFSDCDPFAVAAIAWWAASAALRRATIGAPS